MPTKTLNNRLQALESLYRRDRIIVVARLPDGTEVPLSVNEMVEQGAAFCRVLEGSDLSDLDRILESIAKEAVIE